VVHVICELQNYKRVELPQRKTKEKMNLRFETEMLHVCIYMQITGLSITAFFGPKQYRMRLKNSFWKKIQIEKRDW